MEARDSVEVADPCSGLEKRPSNGDREVELISDRNGDVIDVIACCETVSRLACAL